MMDFANFVDSIWGTDKAQLGVPRERERGVALWKSLK